MDIYLWNCGETCSKVHKTVSHRKCTKVRIFMGPDCFSLQFKWILQTIYQRKRVYKIIFSHENKQDVTGPKVSNTANQEREQHVYVTAGTIKVTYLKGIHGGTERYQGSVFECDTSDGGRSSQREQVVETSCSFHTHTTTHTRFTEISRKWGWQRIACKAQWSE